MAKISTENGVGEKERVVRNKYFYGSFVKSETVDCISLS